MGVATLSIVRTPHVVTACLCFAQGFVALQGLGFQANYLDISKHNGGLITGIGNTIATGTSYLSPMVASWLLTGKAIDESDNRLPVFLFLAASNLVGLAVYLPLCSTVPVDDDEWKRK